MNEQGNDLPVPPNPPPILIADHPALDFLNSVGAPHGTEIEWLENGSALLSWMTAAGILAPLQATEISEAISAKDLDSTAEKARDLREWLRELLARQGDTEAWRLDTGQIETINSILQTGTHRFRLKMDISDGGLELAGRYEVETADDLLLPIAHAIADLLTETDRILVRQCAGPTCTFWFNDLTKNRKRRWCDMKICGNRAKSAAFRERKKEN